MLSGTLGSSPLTNGRLNGDSITFSAGGATYTGTVNGNSMKGTTGTGTSWSATKKFPRTTSTARRPTASPPI